MFLPIARGGLSTEYLFLTCYADYIASEYLLGAGPISPNKLTVAYDRMWQARSYDLYRRAHDAGEFGNTTLMTEDEHADWLDGNVEAAEEFLRELLEGRESVGFLAPMGLITR